MDMTFILNFKNRSAEGIAVKNCVFCCLDASTQWPDGRKLLSAVPLQAKSSFQYVNLLR